MLSSVVSSQVDLHARYGGVVPEIASRAHVDLLTPVVAQALVEAGLPDGGVDAVAATVGPGLIGSLLVGVSAAKALALVWDVPFVGVNHLEAHLYAGFLEDPALELPVVVLLVSRRPHDARAHGGPRPLPRCSARRSTTPPARPSTRSPATSASATPAVRPSTASPWRATRAPSASPGPMADDGYDFSFSGLKTAVVNHVRKHPEVATPDVAAAFQEAVVDVLVTKARRAAAEVGAKGMCLGGGVAANSLLRERFLDACADDGLHAFVPSRAMCTDNAAMVAAAGWWRLQQRRPDPPRRRRRPEPAPARRVSD